MRKNNSSATAFAVLIWTALIIFLARDAYEKLMKMEVSIIPNPKTIRELLNGNP